MSPVAGNLLAIGIIIFGLVAGLLVEKLQDRHNQNKYRPRPTHKGASYRR